MCFIKDQADTEHWFEHLEKSFSYKEVQLKTFCLPVKTSWFPAENVDETLLNITLSSRIAVFVHLLTGQGSS